MMAQKLAMSAPPPSPPPPPLLLLLLLLPLSPASAAGAAVVPVGEPVPVVGVAPSTGEAVGVPTGSAVGAEDGRPTVVTPAAAEAVSTSALARDAAWLTNAAEVNVAATEVARSEWLARPADPSPALTVKLAVHS